MKEKKIKKKGRKKEGWREGRMRRMKDREKEG